MKVLTLRNLSDKIISALRKLNASKYCQKLNKKEEFIMTKENGVLKGPMTEEDLALLNENPAEFWDGVTTIGTKAFMGCKSLTSISIPNTIEKINGYAFAGLAELVSVDLPEGLKEIGNGSFYRCAALTKIEIPQSVEKIGVSSFFFCSGLTKIEIPHGVEKIGDCAFYGCGALTEIEIQNGVKEIGRSAFMLCDALTEIEIPGSVEKIGDCAFECCGSLSIVRIQKGVKEIGKHAFNRCDALTTIELPYGIEKFGEGSFGSFWKQPSNSNNHIQKHEQEHGKECRVKPVSIKKVDLGEKIWINPEFSIKDDSEKVQEIDPGFSKKEMNDHEIDPGFSLEERGKVRTVLGATTTSSANSCIQAYDQEQGM